MTLEDPMIEANSPSEQHQQKIQSLAKLLGFSMEEMASFSSYGRCDDYLGLALALGFDLQMFFNTPTNELDFSVICTKGGYIEECLSKSDKVFAPRLV